MRSIINYWNKRRINEINGVWKGDDVGYCALHSWVKRRLIKPTMCPKCNKVGWIELSNKSGEYERDLSDWEYTCRSCHASFHDRTKNFNGKKPWSVKSPRIIRKCDYCKKEYSLICSILKRKNRGRFCSHLCSDKGRGKP